MPTAIQSEPFVQKSPRSALRHRPIQPQTRKEAVAILTPRASQTKSQRKASMHTTAIPVATTRTHKRLARKSSKKSGSWLIYLVLGMLITMTLLWIGQSISNWGNTVIDDVHYGRPRTTNVDHFVGHETGNIPSHFIALNLNGQIYVVEIPGGSTSTSHLLVGPHLLGPGADLAPVSLTFTGDPQHPDLLIMVNGIQERFHNTGDAYVQM
jgi:hypothetical protein